MNRKTRIFFEDLILIITSVVGVGFLGGAEIKYYFCYPNFFISILIFLILFALFFNIVLNFSKKHKIKSFFELNDFLFPKFVNKIFIVFYLVLSSSMLAGVDALARDVLGLDLPILSIILSVFVFCAILKGVDGIKKMFLKFVPILLAIMFINVFVNAYCLTDNFYNLKPIFVIKTFDVKNIMLSVLFFGSNFIFAINSIILSRGNKKKTIGSLLVVLCVLLMLGSITIINIDTADSMPLLVSSNNLSRVFFWIYFSSLILTIFASLTVSSFNEITLGKFNSNYSIILILLVNLFVSFLGFKFIIKYLYIVTGAIGIIYLIVLLIKIKILKNK